LPDVLHRALRALAGALQDVAGIAEQIPRSATHVAECLAYALEQLRVAIECGEDARQDRRHVVQSRLQQRLRLHALNLELDFAEARGGTSVDLDEVASLGQDGEVGPQVIELELDLIDLDDRRVDIDIDGLVDLVRIDDRVVRQIRGYVLLVAGAVILVRAL
jgi:hypothetical protein